MKKRGNENSQMRPEEVEALNDAESSGGGVYTRAPPEELATRRIIKLKRPGIATGNSATDKANNPFAGFGTSIAQPTTSSFAPSAAAASNPFGGFTGLVAPSSSAPVPNNMFDSFVANAVKSNPVTSSKEPEISLGGETVYKTKMRKLNKSILSWMDCQIIEHPLSIWKDGLKDYVRYSIDISTKYGGDEKTVSSVELSTKNTEPKPTSSVPSFSSSSNVENKPPVSFPGFGVLTAPGSVVVPSTNSSSLNFFPAPTDIGSSSGTAAAPAFKAIAAFNWGVPGLSSDAKFSSAATTSFAVPAFSFSGASAAPVASSGMFGGFGVPPPAAGTEAAEGDEDEGEPIMEAEKILRNEDDKDDIIVDCPCKLLRFDTGKGDTGKGEWIDVGKGTFRVTKCQVTGKQRMLVRNSVGKIIFNAAFYKGMKVKKFSKDKLSFGVVVDASLQLRNFLLKLKETDIDTVLAAIEAAVGCL